MGYPLFRFLLQSNRLTQSVRVRTDERVEVNMCVPLSTAGMHVLTDEALHEQLIYAHLFIPFPRNKVGLTFTIPSIRVPICSLSSLLTAVCE